MNPISAVIFIIFIGGAVLSRLADMPISVTVVLALIGIFLGYSVKMAQQWERAVILRLGKLHAVKGPGLFILVPIFDQVATWIDQRIRTTEVNAEQALTKDTVPVNVDAIVFWMVHDAERAALEIADYVSAVQRVAQTSLREMIGSSVLSELLSERKERRRRPEGSDRLQDRRMGRHGEFGGDPRCRHSRQSAGRHEPPGPGRARETGARHPGFGGRGSGAEIRQCRQALCPEPGSAAAARHEHHL